MQQLGRILTQRCVQLEVCAQICAYVNRGCFRDLSHPSVVDWRSSALLASQSAGKTQHTQHFLPSSVANTHTHGRVLTG